MWCGIWNESISNGKTKTLLPKSIPFHVIKPSKFIPKQISSARLTLDMKQ
jgi:hypothetical protein